MESGQCRQQRSNLAVNRSI